MHICYLMQSWLSHTDASPGFVFFVGSLQKGHYRFQFTQFAWTHMALYLIVVQAHFIMNNIFEGMIWFFLPASLVITNDIFAYICGITFGRTQLIKLSPKKTVEGFVGAWVLTIVFGYGMTNILMRYKYFICPVNVCLPSSSLSPCIQSHRSNALYSLLYANLPRNRISAPTFSPASPAPQTQSSSPPPTLSPSPKPPSSSRPCSYTYWSSRPSLRSSRPLADSSPRASSARSRSRTLANQSPATAASRTAWIASSSWASSPSCITRASSPSTRPASATSSRPPSRAYPPTRSPMSSGAWPSTWLSRDRPGRAWWSVWGRS